MTSRKQIESGVSGANKKGKGHENSAVTGVDAFQLTHMGFGLKTGDMWIQVKADDGKGNEATTSHFVEIGKVPGMSSVR